MDAQEEYADIEIVIVIDADGEYRVGEDAEIAGERYNEDMPAGTPTEVIVLKLRKKLPKPIEVSATLPQSDSGEYRLEIQQS